MKVGIHNPPQPCPIIEEEEEDGELTLIFADLPYITIGNIFYIYSWVENV